jgi:hypothetical protein
MKRRGTLATAVALALLATACATNGHAPVCSQEPGIVSPDGDIQMNTVGIVDAGLVSSGPFSGKGRIAVSSTNARRTATGTLEARAHVRNCTAEPIQLEARALFFDEDKFPVEEPTAWTRIFLPTNSAVSYQALSANDRKVAFYYLELREAH